MAIVQKRVLVLLEQQGLTFMAEQAQLSRLKLLSELRDVCLVSNRVWQVSLLIHCCSLLWSQDYKLGRIYARTNAALVDKEA